MSSRRRSSRRARQTTPPPGALEVAPGVYQSQSNPEVIYFNPNPSLDYGQQKYCRCIVEVAGRQPRWCNQEQAKYETRGGRGCYLPFAVCGASVGNTSPCSQDYAFANFPDEQLIAYADLRRIPMPEPYDRQTLLNVIEIWNLPDDELAAYAERSGVQVPVPYRRRRLLPFVALHLCEELRSLGFEATVCDFWERRLQQQLGNEVVEQQAYLYDL